MLSSAVTANTYFVVFDLQLGSLSATRAGHTTRTNLSATRLPLAGTQIQCIYHA
jgi:hypothetical protein